MGIFTELFHCYKRGPQSIQDAGTNACQHSIFSSGLTSKLESSFMVLMTPNQQKDQKQFQKNQNQLWILLRINGPAQEHRGQDLHRDLHPLKDLPQRQKALLNRDPRLPLREPFHPLQASLCLLLDKDPILSPRHEGHALIPPLVVVTVVCHQLCWKFLLFSCQRKWNS